MIVRVAGASAAAVGATGIVWLVSSTASGAADREPLTYAALVAIVGWLGLRGRSPRPSALIAARDALRTTCGAAIPLFLVANLLAAYHDTRLAAHGASMRSDLRNLWTLQQNVHADSGRYLGAVSPNEYTESYGVIGPSLALTADGWTASVQHETSPQTCVIFAGSTPLAPAVTAGTPACTRIPLDKMGFAFNLALVVGGLLIATVAVQHRARQSNLDADR